MIMKYEYSTDENGNNRVDRISKGRTETKVTDRFGNNIYFKNDTIEKKTNIEYYDNENGNIKSMKNNFGTYFNYNKDGQLISSGNIDNGFHLTHKKEKINDNTIICTTFDDDTLIEKTLEQTFDNGSYIKSTAYYDNEQPEECFEISVQSQLSNNRIEFEHVQPGYIYKNEYDENDNLIDQKCFIAHNETKYKYDDKNNKIEETVWAKNKLVKTTSTDIIYDELGRIKEKNVEIKENKEEA